MVNKVILIGNVGADPEIRVLETGVKMARLRLATTEIFNNADGEKCQYTQWHSVVLWRGAADIAQKYIRTGSQIYVEGKIRSREITDPATHAAKTVYEIIGEEVRLLGRKPAENKPETEPVKLPHNAPNADGLPF